MDNPVLWCAPKWMEIACSYSEQQGSVSSPYLQPKVPMLWMYLQGMTEVSEVHGSCVTCGFLKVAIIPWCSFCRYGQK